MQASNSRAFYLNHDSSFWWKRGLIEVFCTFSWLSSCNFHGFQMQVSWPVASSAWSTWRPEGFQHGTLGDSFVLVGKGGLFVEFTKGESEAWTWQFLLTQNVQYQPQFIHPSSCLETVLTFDTESFADSIWTRLGVFPIFDSDDATSPPPWRIWASVVGPAKANMWRFGDRVRQRQLICGSCKIGNLHL